MIRKIVATIGLLVLLGCIGTAGWLLRESRQREADLASRVVQLEATLAKQEPADQATSQAVTVALRAIADVRVRLDKFERSAFEFGRPDGIGPSLDSRIDKLESEAVPSIDPTFRLGQLEGDLAGLDRRIDRLCGSLSFELTVVSC